jgi:hypothetical protein
MWRSRAEPLALITSRVSFKGDSQLTQQSVVFFMVILPSPQRRE